MYPECEDALRNTILLPGVDRPDRHFIRGCDQRDLQTIATQLFGDHPAGVVVIIVVDDN